MFRALFLNRRQTDSKFQLPAQYQDGGLICGYCESSIICKRLVSLVAASPVLKNGQMGRASSNERRSGRRALPHLLRDPSHCTLLDVHFTHIFRGARPVPGKIFITYRRGDEPRHTTALYMRLEEEFGRGNVIMDVEAAPSPAIALPRSLAALVAPCDVLLAVIGPRWVERLAARAGDPNDFVAIEIPGRARSGQACNPGPGCRRRPSSSGNIA